MAQVFEVNLNFEIGCSPMHFNYKELLFLVATLVPKKESNHFLATEDQLVFEWIKGQD